MATISLSFEQIYNQFHSDVFKFIKYKIKIVADSEELTNDVFVKAFTHLSGFNPELSQIKTWIFNIVKNTIIDYYRTRSSQKGIARRNSFTTDTFTKDDEEYFFQIPDKGVKADSLHDLSIVGRNTMAAINGLKGNAKNVAIEHFVNELDYNEISVKLSLPLGTVKGTLNRVRERLQNELQKEYELI